jgi:2-oxoisovalerate dehydrogenase E1 component alpha subunit
MNREERAAATYFGDGGTSSSDVHAALNFAATAKAPVVFLCRNNGYAISTPSSEQFAGAGVAERAAAYGVRTVRVDGADALAVYAAVAEARRITVGHNCPTLVEVRSCCHALAATPRW